MYLDNAVMLYCQSQGPMKMLPAPEQPKVVQLQGKDASHTKKRPGLTEALPVACMTRSTAHVTRWLTFHLPA